jgi:hypothetical protein
MSTLKQVAPAFVKMAHHRTVKAPIRFSTRRTWGLARSVSTRATL